MKDLAEATMLWLPSYMAEDDEAVASVTQANGLIIDWCDGEIGFEQFLDELWTVDVDVDDYVASLDYYLKQRGV